VRGLVVFGRGGAHKQVLGKARCSAPTARFGPARRCPEYRAVARRSASQVPQGHQQRYAALVNDAVAGRHMAGAAPRWMTMVGVGWSGRVQAAFGVRLLWTPIAEMESSCQRGCSGIGPCQTGARTAGIPGMPRRSEPRRRREHVPCPRSCRDRLAHTLQLPGSDRRSDREVLRARWWHTSADVDCSGQSWCSSLIVMPILDAPRRSRGCLVSRFGHAG